MKRVVRVLLAVVFAFGLMTCGLVACDSNGGGSGSNGEAEIAPLVDGGMDYSEGLQMLDNPYRGFYFPLGVRLKNGDSGNISSSHRNHIANKKGKQKILHLRVSLEAFSEGAGGQNVPISDDAFVLLGDYFNVARENDMTVILRLSYDLDGTYADGKYRESEPPLELMQEHIGQVGEFLGEHMDVLIAVESGMLGPWGEQHGTTASKTPSNFYHIVQKWLDSVENVPISVRRPLFFVHWYNLKYDTDYTIDTIDQIPISVKGTDEFRVGVYNDGYLGSASDLGTFVNREKEIAWLENQTQHTFYGGEVVANSGIIGEFNNVEFLQGEAFRTNTTYLNIEWNNNVIASWKESIYTGSDAVYNGVASDFEYVQNHLGYRFVLRESKISEYVVDGKVRITGVVENVGFAPLLVNVKTSILLESDGKVIDIPCDIDLNSGEFDVTLSLGEFTHGEYAVYLATEGGIAFANPDMFNAELGANRLGTLITVKTVSV